MTGRTPARERGKRLLREGIATTLRLGTILTVGLIAIGYVVALVSGDPGPGRTPLLEMPRAGAAWLLVGVGLIGLTLVPVAMLVVAALGFHFRGEHRMRLAASLVAALLVATLAVAVVVAAGV